MLSNEEFAREIYERLEVQTVAYRAARAEWDAARGRVWATELILKALSKRLGYRHWRTAVDNALASASDAASKNP